MRTDGLVILLLVVMGVGCAAARWTNAQGDVGHFVLQQAIAYGGKPTEAESLPVVASHWRYSEDTAGMKILLPGRDYSSLEAFLDKAFAGSKQFGPRISTDGKHRIHGYRMSPIGGGVQITGDGTETFVVILKPPAGR